VLEEENLKDQVSALKDQVSASKKELKVVE